MANVFDFDGTLIRTNSFQEITRRFLVRLLSRGRVLPAARFARLYAERRCRRLDHLAFKKQVVDLFERSLSEEDKRQLCQSVFDACVNESVYAELLGRDDCLISTASPYAYISRIRLARDVPVISSLEPGDEQPDQGNQGDGKVANLRAHLRADRFEIGCLFTDDPVADGPLIDVSACVMVVADGRMRERLSTGP